MGRERRFRGDQDDGRTRFDWQALAREHGIAYARALALLQEAARRTSRQPWQLRSAYAELLVQAREPAWHPSPGKMTRTMRLAAGGSAWTGKEVAPGKVTRSGQIGKRQRPREPAAPGKVTLTSYLKPCGRGSGHDAQDAELKRLREQAWAFEAAGLPLPQGLQDALARHEPAPDDRALDGYAPDGYAPDGYAPEDHAPEDHAPDDDVSHDGALEASPGADVLAGTGGRPLPPAVQAKMERAFGADFSAVRVHEDAEAAALGARAYARGADIHFAPGRYDPKSQAGQALLGHELAHMVQQAQGRLRATARIQGQPVSTDAALEREADELGARAARGERVPLGWHGAPVHDMRATGTAAVIARQVEDESPAVTVEQVLRHLREERWDVDSLAAQLTDAQMRTLSVSDRVRLVDYISGGHVVGNEDEQTIVRLLATTPAAHAGSVRAQLGTERLQQLDSAIDFDDYRDYHSALRRLFFRSLTPEQAAEQMAGARVFPWADPGLIQSLWNVRFYYDEVELHDDGKLHVRYWVNWGAFGVRTEEVRLDPFEMIAVRFLYPEEYAGAERDQTLYMPAINLRGLHRHQFRNELQTAVDTGLLLAGGAGLIGAGTRLARAVAALDLAMGAADLVIRDFRHQIARSDQGRDFLAAWDIVSTLLAVYGIGRVALEAPRAIERLRQAWQRLRGTGATGDLGRLDDQVDDVLDAADEVDDAARQSARDQDVHAAQGGSADAMQDGAPGARASDGRPSRDTEDPSEAASGNQQPQAQEQRPARPPGRHPVADWTEGSSIDACIQSHGRPHQGRFPNQSSSGGREILVRRTDDGNVTAYMVYDDAGMPVKRVDIDPSSAPHAGIAAPHVVDFTENVAPNGRSFRRPGATRPARPEEYLNLRDNL